MAFALGDDIRRAALLLLLSTPYSPHFPGILRISLWQNLILQMKPVRPSGVPAVALSAIHQDTEAKGMPLAAEIPFEPENTLLLFAQRPTGTRFQPTHPAVMPLMTQPCAM